MDREWVEGEVVNERANWFDDLSHDSLTSNVAN